MSVHVIATAGHVDHGKSTLVRALTGMEPDRWAEERRRGLTIDLGFAWLTLPSGRAVAFVDVPGHERFLGNMLAGLGPAPVVCFVVAADEGWQAQSSDHRDAIAALGISDGVLVITKADRAPDRAGAVLAQARSELAATGLAAAPAVVVAAVDGSGLDDLRVALDDLLARQSVAISTGRLRIWIDRSFSITGAGTIVTGTLTSGSVATGQRLQLFDGATARPVVVRELESRGERHATLAPVNRVALNLRGVTVDQAHRGDVLLTPDAWPYTAVVDVRRVTGAAFTDAPEQLTVHVGTAAVPARLRPFDGEHARLTLARRLPIVAGDRLLLRHPGSRRVLGGAQVLDSAPGPLRRRGDSAVRARVLAAMDAGGDVRCEVARHGAVAVQRLRMLGLVTADGPPDGVRAVDDWWVDAATYDAWAQQLRTAVTELHARDPLAGGLSRGAARDLLGVADEALLTTLVPAAGLEFAAGEIRLPGTRADLGPAEAAVVELETRLQDAPFRAPEADYLTELGLGVREVAAAARAGRLLRLRGGVVLLPSAPALAMRVLAQLDQPFTTSQARAALDTTRRVAIPLLDHLDAHGWTRRLDAGHREAVR